MFPDLDIGGLIRRVTLVAVLNDSAARKGSGETSSAISLVVLLTSNLMQLLVTSQVIRTQKDTKISHHGKTLAYKPMKDLPFCY